MKALLFKLCILSSFASAGLGTASAEIIFHNYGLNTHSLPISPEYWHAYSFVTDTQPWQLTSVQLELSPGLSDLGGFTVSLWDASGPGNTPGQQLVSLSGSSNPQTSAWYDYQGSYSLSPSTPYYIVASVADGGGNYSWIGDSYAELGTTIGESTFSAADPTPWWSPPFWFFGLHTEVNAIPEPSTATLLVFAVFSSLILRRSHGLPRSP